MKYEKSEVYIKKLLCLAWKLNDHELEYYCYF